MSRATFWYDALKTTRALACESSSNLGLARPEHRGGQNIIDKSCVIYGKHGLSSRSPVWMRMPPFIKRIFVLINPDIFNFVQCTLPKVVGGAEDQSAGHPADDLIL